MTWNGVSAGVLVRITAAATIGLSGSLVTSMTSASAPGTRTAAAATAPSPPAAVVTPNRSVLVTPTRIVFGDQEPVSTSPSKQVTISNQEPSAITIQGITVAGGDSGDFVVTGDHCSHSTLRPGGSCAVAVAFRPASGTFAPRSSVLEITDTGANSPQGVTLLGTVASPDVEVNPSDLSFGVQLPSTSSPPQTVTLTNGGRGDLEITGLSLDNNDNFAVVGGDCLTTIPPGASCTVKLYFSPKFDQRGFRSGVLTITDNDPGSPQQVVSVDGTAATAVGVLSTTSLSFPSQTAGTRGASSSVTLTNTGSGPLVITALSIAGVNPDSFVITANTCPGELAPGQSCTLSIASSPKDTDAGPLSALLTISVNDNAGTHTVVLKGTAIAAEAKPAGTGFSTGSNAVPAAAPAVPADQGSPTVPSQPPAGGDLVEQRGAVTYSVARGDVPTALDALVRISGSLGGYVETSDTSRDARGDITAGRASVRVPVSVAGGLSGLVAGAGRQFRTASLKYFSVDHTADAQDLRSRLAAAVAQATALAKAHSLPHSADETASLDQQISQTQQTIDQLQRQLELIAESVQMATATVEITDHEPPSGTAPARQQSSVMGTIRAALADDWRVLQSAVVPAVALLPVAVLAAPAWLGARLWLRRRRSGASRSG